MRTFTEHYKRKSTLLDGEWLFLADRDNVGEKKKWYKKLPATDRATVPSVWNTRLDMLDYEGACWYSRDFYFEGGTARIVFEASMTDTAVWLDGEKLGTHYGGFTAFSFIVANLSEGNHTLTVRVDNSFDMQSIPQKQVDWYHYGGIIRSVYVERLSGISVLSARFEYKLLSGRRAAEAKIVMDVYNAQDEKMSDTVRALVAGASVSLDVELDAREFKTVETKAFTLKGFKLWSQDNPVLYNLTVFTDSDDLIDRVGLREVSFDKKGILINGKRVEILGVNRHEEYTECGFAVPPQLMRRDIDIIENMNCNSIRGSHYPNSKYFVDMLDERGITFWSEIPIWGGGFSLETLVDPVVIERGLQMHREMVAQYYNHPSIIIWGMHNEIKSDEPESVTMSRVYYEYLKQNGGNRIVSYATCHPLTDICLEYCDVICINKYTGWYGGEISEWQSFLDDFGKRRRELGFENKPVIMSEFGGAAVWGHRSFDDIRWSEEYQARLIGHCLESFHNDPMVVGMYIWQYCDIRTCYEMGLGRARSYNNKGLVNEHRNPKASYFVAKDLFASFKKK